MNSLNSDCNDCNFNTFDSVLLVVESLLAIDIFT